ncbi:adenylyl-sulfate kinase [Candidatus Blochmannia ocreatus (nom. nud.)]|uniref:Adenylyl-sulfate kinase n=1 Tax=Candidatus Blochmannia ocreatus (nom. nud.) TaxID=251538 RepID=A0ABY4SWS4_9ENTR|nr:adenylyl-sulfate kinase [Candidatus Blochmannia ocreatus]URJ25246.1 adenylyl-sulfate kinase [Candidatus Blochmannia ocreatus]
MITVHKKNPNILQNKNIFWNTYHITQKDRECLHKHHAILLWFTGLSGSGKSAVAGILEKKLYQEKISTYILDGDNIRCGLCSDLGFSSQDRHENIRRIGEIARLMVDAGIVVLATCISPYQSDRIMIRNMFPQNCFVEIFVDTPINICEARDPKGLYKKARSGEIKNFIGVHIPYEIPKNPDIHLDGTQSVKTLINQLMQSCFLRFFFKNNCLK